MADNFEKTLLRLKQQLGVPTDKEAAELLGLSDKALNARKRRGVFPDEKLLALIAKRPELKLDFDFITTGHSAASFEAIAAHHRPAHMQPGLAGREAALLRHWRALPEPLQEQVSDLAETLANLYLRTGKD